MPALSGGWGHGEWGAEFWGAGGSDLALLTARAVRENVVRLSFNHAPVFTGVLDPQDAANPERYSVTVVDGIGLDGEAVRPVSPVLVEQAAVPGAAGAVLDLWVDRAFSHWPCRYRVSCTNLVASGGGLLEPGSSLIFDAVQRGMPPRLADQAAATRDIANPQVRSALFDPLPTAAEAGDLILGTFPVDGLGDYATDEGLVSYRKRVIRRLVTRRGAFPHLPNYGVGIPQAAKQLARPGSRESLAAEAEAQIRQEPETVEVRVAVVADGATTRFVVRARTTFGDANLSVPVPFSTGT